MHDSYGALGDPRRSRAVITTLVVLKGHYEVHHSRGHSSLRNRFQHRVSSFVILINRLVSENEKSEGHLRVR